MFSNSESQIAEFNMSCEPSSRSLSYFVDTLVKVKFLVQCGLYRTCVCLQLVLKFFKQFCMTIVFACLMISSFQLSCLNELLTDFLKWLFHYLVCLIPMVKFLKACQIIQIISYHCSSYYHLAENESPRATDLRAGKIHPFHLCVGIIYLPYLQELMHKWNSG